MTMTDNSRPARDRPDARRNPFADSPRERRFGALLGSVPDLAYIFDSDHRFTYANRATLAMWGKAWKDAAGKTCLELGYPDWHAAMHDREIDEVIATKRPVKGEVPFAGTNGRRIYEYIFVPIFGPDGAVEAVGGTTRDVTDRKRREERDSFLVELNDALRLAAGSDEITAIASRMLGEHLGVGRCGYGEVDDSGEFFTVEGDWTDGKMASMAGTIRLADFGADIVRDYRAGHTIRLVDPASDHRTRGAEAAYAGAGGVRAGIGVPLVKQGRFMAAFYVHQTEPREWAHDEVALVEDVAERIWLALERARAEAAVRQSEERLRALTTASADVVYRMSADWSEMRHLEGRKFLADTAEPSRRWLDKYIHPEDQQRVMAAIDDAVRTKSMFDLEHRVLQADGNLGWTHSRAVPLLDERGDIIEWIGSASDVTARKQAENAMREASRSKDEFLAMLGHELRNPLAPILTSLQLMHMRAPDTLVKERAIIERQVRHVVALVDDLLDVSRIARGRVELHKQPLDIGEIVAKSIETVTPLLEECKQQVKTDVPESLITNGDSRRLVQIVTNLLTNAAKYSPPERTIHISAAAEDGELALSVRDEGFGINRELLPKVFQTFAQGPQSIDRSQGGLGLGLAIVHNLVTLHGGRIEALSDGRNRGSEFIVHLPLLDQQRPEQPVTAGAAPTAGRSANGNIKVLIVDDFPDAATGIAELLELAGYETRVAYDGAAALKIAAEFRPTVALLDIGLPAMDGYELGRRLRLIPGLERLKLVAVTGYGQDKDRQRAKDAGFREHVVKPIDPARIGALMEQITTSA